MIKWLLIALILVSANVYANTTKDTTLFVCGGDTGRGIISKWYIRTKYDHLIKSFSRGSGIDPDDPLEMEPLAKQLIVEYHSPSEQLLNLHRAIPISLIDIHKSNLILTMEVEHSKRLFKMIKRECSAFNLNYLNHNHNKYQWHNMCLNRAKLEAKIHTLIGCATGTDGDIADPYGKDKESYINTRNEIIRYIDIIMANYQKNGRWCVIPQSN